MPEKKYTLPYRLLHWAIAFSMLFMLLTIFLRLNWMNKHNMADIMTAGLSELNIAIGEDEAISIAKAMATQTSTYTLAMYWLVCIYFECF